MDTQDILNLGFNQRRLLLPSLVFIKNVRTKLLPPFFIRVEKSDLNDTDWRVLKEGNLISIVSSVEQLRQCILVLTLFERDSFKD